MFWLKKFPSGETVITHFNLKITYEDENFEIKFPDKTVTKIKKKIIVKDETGKKEYPVNKFNEIEIRKGYSVILNKAIIKIEHQDIEKITITPDGKQYRRFPICYNEDYEDDEQLIQKNVINSDDFKVIRRNLNSILILPNGESTVFFKNNIKITHKLDGSRIEQDENGLKTIVNPNKTVETHGNTTITTYQGGTKIIEHKRS